MKRELVQKLREFCPNIRIVEKAIAWCRKCQLTHGSLSSKKVKEAEKSLRIKKKVVAKYKNRRKLEKIDGQIQSLFDTAPQYVNESATRLDNIREDMKFCFIAYGFTPYEYLCLDLEGNDYDYRKTFISSRDQHIYQAVVNNVIDSAVLIDKSKTYEKFTKFYRRDAITLTDAEDLESFFSFIEKHSIFVTKPVYSGLGKGIQRIDSSTYSDNIRELFDNILNKGKTLVEEILIQGNIMGSFNADSVNTVRVVTMSTRGGGAKNCLLLSADWKGRLLCG